MPILTFFFSIVFSLFAVVVSGYVSLATPIGPWVEMIVALLALLVFSFLFRKKPERIGESIGLTTVAGGVAGIAATACGFTLPTLYFLDKALFLKWAADPFNFSCIVFSMVMVGGLFAFLCARFFEQRFLADERMPFPIGRMVSGIITSASTLRKAMELLAGAIGTFAFNGIQYFTNFIPKAIQIFSGATVSVVQLPALILPMDILLTFVAIGFVAGSVLLVPLFVGTVSKVFLVEPARRLFFPALTPLSFILAFGSGLILFGVGLDLLKLPVLFKLAISALRSGLAKGSTFYQLVVSRRRDLLLFGAAVLSFISFFTYWGLSPLGQLYVFFFSAVCVYQLLVIGGKTGLAPFGRFATFVMLPGYFLFSFDGILVTFVSLFVGLAGGIAVDLLFGRVMARHSDIAHEKVALYQFIGLVVAALSMGYVFWLFIQHLGLGSSLLIAQRAQSRALLIQAFQFDFVVLLLGVAFAAILHFLRINTVLVFTGLLFSVEHSLLLIIGGLLTLLVRKKEAMDPFWSGVYAAGALSILIKVLIS
ncbi:MAG: hypothetical protein UW09_C0001G0293 [candidate division TM6 bacterium GW2011_GWF2_43_87]|nr:MAG: hypothetical protein UW09_C0001G0293 [candidate division TM6 bacterium GW2011_GWF2_43_87]